MKYLKTILFVLAYSLTFAQSYTVTPQFPTETDSIEITFYINEMIRTDLLGYTGTLYTHTGVNTNLGNWQYVIGNWGDNSVQPALTWIAEDTYKIIINNPRNYYGITNPVEKISSLNFVLRSADGQKQTEDLFVNIYEEGLNIEIITPTSKNSVVKVGDSIQVNARASLADSILLYVDDVLIASSTSDTLDYLVEVTNKQRKSIITTAKNSIQSVSDTVYFIGRDNIVTESLPNGIKTGINYTSSTSVILALYAPRKEFVYLIGDFNNWELDSLYELKLTPDSTIWWIELTNLTPKKEYAFQYLVSGNILIADPYTDKVLDEDYDEDISDYIYPNLKPYPKNKTKEIVSTLQTDQTPYVWQVDNFQRPQKEDLVIYELLVRDFVEDHSFKTIKDSLSYLSELGVNAIELMPVMEFRGNNNWGYEPHFQFAVDKYYGTKNDLKYLIDECHKLGISVILDVVLNHIYGRSPFVRLYNEGGYGKPTPDNPWLNPEPRHPFNVGYDFNHESPQTQELVDRFNKYWLEEYNVDGFRFDLSKGMTQTYSGDDPALMARYDQSRIDILTRMGDEIKSYDSTAFLILEHYADNSEETVLANYGFMIWGKLTDPYNEATMGYHDNGKSDFSSGSYKVRGWSKPNLVTLMENHDEERLMYKNLKYGNSAGNYNIKDTTTALNRMKLALAFFYTIPGPKLIWKFGELGYDYSKFYDIHTGIVMDGNDGVKLDRKPIRWDYLDDPNRLNLFKVNKALINLKKNYDVFKTDNFTLNVASSTKRIQLTHSSMNAIIIGNFDVVSKGIIPGFQNTGKWYDYFSGDSINVTNTQAFVQLEPGEFHIYTTVKLPTPEPDILTSINSDETIPVHFSLSQNYPNPFNPSTTINYSIPNVASSFSLSKVTLKIYDILGREITTLVNEQQKPGNYEVEFNGKNLSSGIYFYTLSAGDFFETKKMIMLK